MIPVAVVALVTVSLTLKSDTQPIKIYVKKPRGTLYWGGAGLDGPYIQPQLKAFQNAGIHHVYVGLTNSATHTATEIFPNWILSYGKITGTLTDAARAGLPLRYQDDGDWILTNGMDNGSKQFNLIGYSYGSLLAAQTAWFYARQGHVIDNLVLLGSPIDKSFLTNLKNHKNVKKVIVINLTEYGDPIYAGMTQLELIESSATLGKQMQAERGEGHFYYAHVVSDSPKRWKKLAERLFDEGLR